MAVVQKYVHLTIGWFCIALAMIGAVLPLLPTTVFVLLAAYFFAKGSPRLRLWLVEHAVFGPLIHDWEETGAIAPRYKCIALGMMGAALLLSVVLGLSVIILLIQAACMSAAACYILTRPSA
ncbi:YbaN family protein [Celeribacter sp.]|uniref:YbaN family protein n=1 Tax=Celeribacter sp. TaxID=1890673 RepID=UPI003A942839